MRLPLSAPQKGVWFAHQLDPGGHRYNCGEYIAVDGPVDVAAFELAWLRLCEEADAVRVAHVTEDDAGLWQHVLDPADPALAYLERLPYFDFTGAADPGAAARRWMDADMAVPVDLGAGPISAFALLKVAESRFLFYCRMHHVVTDAYGIRLLGRRLAEIYTALVLDGGRVARTFGRLADLTAEDAAYRSSPGFAADRSYWTARFADRPDPVRLAEAGPDITGNPVRHRTSRDLPAAERHRLERAAAAAGTGWQTVAIAMVAAYAHRVTGRRDVTVGLPVSARRTAVSLGTPGMVTNTVALRLDVSPGLSLAGLAGQVVAEIGQALRHERYRHEDLCRDLGITREGGLLGPLVNIMPHDPDLAFGGSPATRHNLSAGPAVDLSVGVASGPSGEPASLVLEANPEFHDAQALAEHRDRLAEFGDAVLAGSDRSLRSFDTLSAGERHRLLVEWNDTAGPVAPTSVADQISARAARTPLATAVEHEGTTVTYAELDARSTEIARHLAERGAGPETFAALLLPRSPELIAAMLAVLKAGAAYVPIDPSHPAERIRYVLADCTPACVITDETREPLVPDDIPRLILEAPSPGTPPVSGVWGEVDAENPAYLIYTSGSTGTPKGVVVSRSSLANLVADHVGRFACGAGERVLQFVSPGFDVAVEDIWPVLVSGGTLVLAPEGPDFSVEELLVLLHEQRITHASIPPVVLANLDAEGLPGLSVLRTGGEALDPAVVRRWAAGRRMVNMYGPTETCVAATVSPALTGDRTPPIGHPLTNYRLYVLDGHLHPVPPGAAGELYIAGAGLARGYLGQPARTADRFLPCPFGPEGARMYRTGDLVRWRPDGELEYLGRVDDQVKVRGHRVELGEIEAVLTRHDDVRAAVAMVREDEPGRKRLVAYVVPEGVSPDELRRFAARSVPDYMVPAVVVPLGSLPVTRNGKVDRRALPRPASTVAASSDVPPAGGRERVLRDAFAEVLGTENVGVTDSFFDRGGDSIMALQLAAAARRAGLEITSGDVFRHPTVAGLAAVAREAGGPDAEPPGAGVGPVPATPIVRWLEEQAAPIDEFSQSVRIRVPAGMERGALEDVLQAVVDHHDALRTVLRDRDGWELEVLPPGSWSAGSRLARVGVAGLDEEAVERRIAAERVTAPRRLAPREGAMVWAVWFDAGLSRAGELLLTVHHLAVDGVSWRILLADLAAAWAARSAGRPIELEPVGTSLRTWATRLAGVSRKDELPLWTGVLEPDDPPVCARPLRPGIDTFETARFLDVTVGPAETAPLLSRIPALFHARTADLLITGLVLAYGEWRRRRAGGAGAVLLDLEGHGREDVVPGARIDRTVGWFTSMYPVRLDPGEVPWDDVRGGSGALGAAVKRVKEELRRIPDNGIGFGLLRYSRPAPEALTRRVPQLGFNHLGRFPMAGGEDWGLTGGAEGFSAVADPGMSLVHGVEINSVAYDRDNGPSSSPHPPPFKGRAPLDGPVLRIMVAWAGGLFTEAEVRELVGLWRAALGGLVAYAERGGAGGLTPSDVPLVELSQRQIDALTGERPDISDILPLSPLQEGLLVHHLVTERSFDAYVTQLRVDIAGELDGRRLRAAAEALLRRHPSLRVAFRYDFAQPVQVVCERAALPWTEADLGDFDGRLEEAAGKLAADEGGHRFDLTEPPLIRFLLMRLGAGRHRLLLTAHHIIGDGWSTSVLLRELFALYTSDAEDGGLPWPAPYRDYLAWLDAQDGEAARRAWSRALAGIGGPTLVAPGLSADRQEPHRVVERTLDAERTSAVMARARALGVTVNTVVQAAWGLVLARLTGHGDVVFGSSVSGRPPELPGVEGMVGLLTNTIPVRVRVRAGEGLGALLARVQAEQAELMPHHHLGLSDVQRAALRETAGAARWDRALFDTTVLFANYPMSGAGWAAALPGVRVTGFELMDQTHYPLRLIAVPGDRLELRLGYRPDAFGHDEATGMLDRLAAVLTALIEAPDGPADALIPQVSGVTQGSR